MNNIEYKTLNLENLNIAFKFLKKENYNNLIDEKEIYLTAKIFLKNDFGFILYDKKKVIGVWIMFKSIFNKKRIINLSTMYIIKEYRNIYFHIFNQVQKLEFDYIFNSTMDIKLTKVHEKFGFKKFETNQIFFIPRFLNLFKKKKIEIKNNEDFFDINSPSNFIDKFAFNLSKLKNIKCVYILSDDNSYIIVYRVIKYKNFINIIEILYIDERKECQNLLSYFYKYCLLKHKVIFYKTYDYICNNNGLSLLKRKKIFMYKSNMKYSFKPNLACSELIFFS